MSHVENQLKTQFEMKNFIKDSFTKLTKRCLIFELIRVKSIDDYVLVQGEFVPDNRPFDFPYQQSFCFKHTVVLVN